MAAIELIPFSREHLAHLELGGPVEGGEYPQPTAAVLQTMEEQNSWSAIAEGFPIACGGTLECWPGRHLAWAYIGRHAAPHILTVTRYARRALAVVSGRIETTVRADFAEGQHWARILGFEVETPILRAYGPAGEDHIGYVRFQQE